MAARKRGTVDLSAAIGDEAAEHQDQAGTAAAPVAEAARPARPARPAPSAAPEKPEAPAAAVASAAVQHETKWDARLSLTLSKEMKRALDLARADDGLEGTARIRAMIQLWQDDERLRRRVDRLAKTLRSA